MAWETGSGGDFCFLQEKMPLYPGIRSPSLTKAGGYNCPWLYEPISTLRRAWDSGRAAQARFVPHEKFSSELELLLNVFLHPRGQADLLSAPLGLLLEML